MSKTYAAKVIRDEDALSIEVPEVGRVTQALDLRQVDAMARDLIVVMDDIDPDEIELNIEWPADITARNQAMVYGSRYSRSFGNRGKLSAPNAVTVTAST